MDRSWSSILAFDVYGNGLPEKLLAWVGGYIRRQPDITLLLEAPLQVLQRRKASATLGDTAFARRVRRGYQELARQLSWVHVDATREIPQVKNHCMRVILAKL